MIATNLHFLGFVYVSRFCVLRLFAKHKIGRNAMLGIEAAFAPGSSGLGA
jgi:hypothetical protein